MLHHGRHAYLYLIANDCENCVKNLSEEVIPHNVPESHFRDKLGRTACRNIPHIHSFEILYHSPGIGSLSQNSRQAFFILTCFYSVLP